MHLVWTDRRRMRPSISLTKVSVSEWASRTASHLGDLHRLWRAERLKTGTPLQARSATCRARFELTSFRGARTLEEVS